MHYKGRVSGCSFFILGALAANAWGADDVYRPEDITTIIITVPRSDDELPRARRLDSASLDRLRSTTSDTASLLRDIPGVSLYGAGGVSSLPAVHGLGDDRLRIKVDGMDMISACPNHMNSPLSYIDPTSVADIGVYAGISPVSLGGDSIGGTIVVESAKPEFAKAGAGILTTGEIGTFYRSNGDARGANAKLTVAGENLSATYTGSTAQSDNYKAGGDFKPAGLAAADRGWLDGDVVGSTAYKAINQGINLAWLGGNHLLDLKYGHQHIPYQGFPNQRMDMTDNKSDQVDLGYTGAYGWGELKARAYHQSVDHQMQFGDDRQFTYGTAPGMPMNTRSGNTGAQLKASLMLTSADILRLGGEYQHYTLDDWWPPSGTGMMAPGTFQNINNGQRDRYALYSEWQRQLNATWSGQIGLRHETVVTDTGNVHGYAATNMMGSNQLLDSTNFNGDHKQTDGNWDLTALASYTPNASSSYEFGVAQKTRSPNLYERYAWSTWTMAAIMNNFVGDGNGYVGNPDLKPEVAYTVSATADWHDQDKSHWGLKLTPYYTHVDDYIDAECAGASCAADQFNVLRYVNQSAELYGIDVSAHRVVARTDGYGDFTLSGVVNYTRGENKTTSDGLYNIMPLNATLKLSQTLVHWTNIVEAQFVAGKHDVSAVRNEIETGGYSLFNLRSSYAGKRLRFDVGVENLFDRLYSLPLGGAYVGQGMTMSINGIPWGTAVPGMGRSIYTRLSYAI